MFMHSIFKTFTLPLALGLTLSISAAAAIAANSADYPAHRKEAISLVEHKKYDQAMEAFLKLADEAELPAHKTDALEQAAMVAMAMKNIGRAVELTLQIPDKETSTMVQMRLKSMSKDYDGLLELAGEQDLAKWRDVVAGEAFFYRGNAYEGKGDYHKAASDLENAMQRLGQNKLRAEAGLALAELYQVRLSAPDKAIAIYQLVLDSEARRDVYGWAFATALIGKAQAQASTDDTDAALKTLDQIDLSTRTKGYWAVMLRQARAKIHLQRNEKPQAIQLLKEARTLPKVPDFLKAIIQKQLDDLQAAAP